MTALASEADGLSFDDLRGWATDDHRAAFDAFAASAPRMAAGDYPQRSLSPPLAVLQKAAEAALKLQDPTPGQTRAFFERHFMPRTVVGGAFFTGFYEPVIAGSRERSAAFPVPLLRRPRDLVELDATNRPSSWDADIRFGRRTGDGIVEHPDRGAVMAGALDGQGLELVWLADAVEAFFVHVQGAAKIDLDPTLSPTDPARFMRVTFDGKSGHAYTSLAKLLCAREGIALADMTADKLRAWMHAHPAALPDLLARNRSYIFFREATGIDLDAGPVAAAKVPLIAGRSLAVDRTLHTFGMPFWCETTDALPGNETPLARLMVAHDTGSAITGPARGDIFAGSGDAAGLHAGRIRHGGTMTMLWPNS